MMDYINYPFSSYNRKNLNIPPTPMPQPSPAPPEVPMEEMEEMEQPEQMEEIEEMEQPEQMEEMIPVQPAMPMQPAIPMQQTMPSQLMLPCPQILPCPQMIMPAYPAGCPFLGGFVNTGSLPGISGMQEMGIRPLSSDPPPILSNNPATTRIILTKQLTGYPNYGNPSRNADILYTGNRGTWTFDIPATVFSAGTQRAQLIIRAVLDDHDTPVNRYSARITINGDVVHTGRVPLQHGRPAGGIFTNWENLTFNIRNYRRNIRVVIENTSTNARPDDWIGLDWMQIRITPR